MSSQRNIGADESDEYSKRLFEEAYRTQPNADAPARAVPELCGPLQPSDGILVHKKEMVMKVLLDAEENYSVSGYMDRAQQSFGAIYLCLDKGPEYERQSTKINEALRGITGADAFALALREARKAVSANPDALEPLGSAFLAAWKQ